MWTVVVVSLVFGLIMGHVDFHPGQKIINLGFQRILFASDGTLFETANKKIRVNN